MSRVVVTGMGVISPIGNSVSAFTHSLFEGRAGSDLVKRFDASHLPTKFACEVKDVPSSFRDVKITYAILAAREAVRQAFGEKDSLRSLKSTISIGLGLELFDMEDLVNLKQNRGPQSQVFEDCLDFLSTPSDLCVPLIAMEHGIYEPPMIHISACAASTDAIGSAFRSIQEGAFDVVLAGGADSMINPMGLGGFCRIGALSTKNDQVQTASRPFDRSRDGFVLGEGAGFLVLESEKSARNRGAIILAEVSGYGNSMDAYSISDPHPEGRGARAAMQKAISSAGITADEISAINAHGTGTPKNDPVESFAIRALFGKRSQEIPVSSTKSMTGHLISAGGAVETIAAIQCLRYQRVHPTANLRDVAPDCQLRHVVGEPLEFPLKHILKNSFAFGGQNACLVLSHSGEPEVEINA